MMLEFEWMETFELGVPEIDGDHKSMLDLMKAVRGAAGSEDRAGCEKYVSRLLDHARSHFKREEAFLKRHGYAEVKKHAGYHEVLLQRAAAVAKACRSVETPGEYLKCCEELMSFLVDDVVRGDLKLKSFLQEAGLTLSPQNHRTQTS